VNRSLTGKVHFHAGPIHLDRPPAGEPCKAYQAGRSWRGSRRIIGRQTLVAHHEACTAPYSESDLLGSTGAGSLCAFGVTHAAQQDGCDTEAFHFSALSPRPGDAQVQPALQAERAKAPRTQRSIQRTHWRGYRNEAAKPLLRLPQDCRANIESFRCRDQ